MKRSSIVRYGFVSYTGGEGDMDRYVGGGVEVGDGDAGGGG